MRPITYRSTNLLQMGQRMNESLHGNLRRNSVRYDEGMADVGGVLFVVIFAGCFCYGTCKRHRQCVVTYHLTRIK